MNMDCFKINKRSQSLSPIASVSRILGAENVKRILRIETCAQEVILSLPDNSNLARLDATLVSLLDPPPENVVGFKSICAYRGGLRISNPSYEEADAALKHYISSQQKRIEQGPLRDHILRVVFSLAIKHEKPVQFHIGLGDTDSDLLEANPLLLRPILEDPLFKERLKVILLHTYPYSRQAGFLASVYDNVWVDFGLAIPHLSKAGQESVVRELMELAPLNRILFSSDAHSFADMYYLASLWSRHAIAKVLRECIESEEVDNEEHAHEIAKDIFFGNANNLYKLNLLP
ncbi:amidohydrolase-domain-containing protein [Chytriomyces sp. MP71]|nr:amidohydrolase-domain-containing protein [Chytriomyces sp. MP71]